MTKFSSFLVFVLGIFLLVVSLYTLLKRFASPDKPPEPTMVLPQSDLPPLKIESAERYNRQLDQLFETGGLEAVRTYVQQELVPGRQLTIHSSVPGETAGTFILLDREVRRCNRDGGAMMDKPPLVPRVAVALQVNTRAVIKTWTRSNHLQPFYITAWCIEFR